MHWLFNDNDILLKISFLFIVTSIQFVLLILVWYTFSIEFNHGYMDCGAKSKMQIHKYYFIGLTITLQEKKTLVRVMLVTDLSCPSPMSHMVTVLKKPSL